MHKLHLPRLGQTMERGTIVRWLKAEGDSFEIGDPLYEVETEKVVNEVEAKLPGTLARITVSEGEEHPVGTLLAVIADPGEELSNDDIEAAIAEESETEEPEERPDREAERAPSGAGAGQQRVRAMPKARARAKELDVDLSTVEGTGRNGTIIVEDVEAASGREGAPVADGPQVRERVTLTGLGRTMVEVVSRSWQEIPQFTQVVELDASSLVERRREEAEEIRESHGVDLSYTDLFIEAVSSAVQTQPLANSSLAGGEIVLYEDVNVSVAVATEAGLMVPVIRGVQDLGLGEIAVKLREIAERARSGKLSSEDLAGGTITLSNLGMHGIEGGAPLVTLPQAAVVFLGAMVEKPWAVDGRVEVRPALTVSVSYDHRILDGVAAARFTTALKEKLEGVKRR